MPTLPDTIVSYYHPQSSTHLSLAPSPSHTNNYTYVPPVVPIQQVNIQKPSSDGQRQFHDLESSPFHLNDDSEQAPDDS